MSNIDAEAKSLEELALEKNLTMRDVAKKAKEAVDQSAVEQKEAEQNG